MAGGWAREGAVNEQIEASIEEAVELARKQLGGGEGRENCEECDAIIPEARRKAIPGVRFCIQCQSELEEQAEIDTAFNRRGSKDSQLR